MVVNFALCVIKGRIRLAIEFVKITAILRIHGRSCGDIEKILLIASLKIMPSIKEIPHTLLPARLRIFNEHLKFIAPVSRQNPGAAGNFREFVGK